MRDVGLRSERLGQSLETRLRAQRVEDGVGQRFSRDGPPCSISPFQALDRAIRLAEADISERSIVESGGPTVLEPIEYSSGLGPLPSPSQHIR